MRKVLTLAALAAALGVSLVGSAGATGGLPEVPEVPVPEVCRTVEVPAHVGLGVANQKKITLAGVVLDANIDQEVIRVEKEIAVEVCVRTEGDVIADADLDGGVNVDECENGEPGAHINVPLKLKAGLEGGAVVASVKIRVADEDRILGQTWADEEVVISEERTVLVPPAGYEDAYAVDADACVGPVAGV